MRKWVVAAWVAACLSGGQAWAQDEEAGGEDLDALMASDPERTAEAEADEESEGAEEPSEGLSDEALRMSDDERPPGDEKVVRKPKRTAAETEAESDPGHPHPVSLGVLAGYGLNLDSGGGNAWSFGFGARGGYNFSAFYLGGRFVYYIGETYESTQIGVFGERFAVEASVNLWEFGFEGGFDIDLSSTTALRPGFGLGIASVSSVESETAAYVAPGLSFFYGVSETVFLGLDARYQAVLTTPTASGLVLLANLGMRL